jgi:class 3 adenylate cyclase/putative methionine-R-sulfoxide reductase with GAF domain
MESFKTKGNSLAIEAEEENFVNLRTVTDRKLERRTVYAANYSLRPQLFFNDRLIQCEFKNINFSGACLLIKSEIPPLKSKENQLRLNIKQGEKVFCHDINYRIAWEDRNFGHLIGIEFTKSDLPYSRKSDRYFTDINFRPTFLFKDPLEPSRNIYGKVLDLSLDGFSFITSKSNKHLFVGMKSVGTFNTVESALILDIRIQNLSMEGEHVRIGVSVKNTEEYKRAFKKYLATFCFEFPLDNTQMAKNIGDAISFFRVEEEDEYKKVVDLRYQAYASKDKLNDDAKLSLAPGIDKEGIIIGGYINGELMCSVELKVKSQNHEFLVEKYYDLSGFGYELDSLLEINRLCIHPKAQRSDVLLTLFKKIHLFSLNNNCMNALLSSTEELLAIYLRLGAQDTGKTYEHPTLKGKKLHLLTLDTKAYLEAKTLNPLLWKIVYGDTHVFAHSLGLVQELKFGLWDKIVLKSTDYFFKRKARKKGLKTVETVDKLKEESILSYTRSDFSTQVIYPYLKAAILLSDDLFVDSVIDQFGLSRSYFENPNNWVSIEFFDNFLQALGRKLDLDDLAILAGEFAMRKELVGPGYYVLKWFGNITFFINQIKKTTAKLNTNRFVNVESISSNSIMVSFHLKEGFRLPKHRSSDLNFQTLLHHGICLVQNLKRSDVVVDQIASAYDTNGASRFKVTWKQNSNWLKYLGFLGFIALNVVLYQKFSDYRVALLATNAILLLIRNVISHLNFKKAFREIDSFYSDVEENSKKQYDVLFQTKQTLEKHHHRLELLNGISGEIHYSKSISSIIETTSKLICEQFNFSRCMIMLKDSDNFLRTHSVYSLEDVTFLNLLWGFEIDLSTKKTDKKVVSTAYHSRQTILIRDVNDTLEDLTDFSKELIEKLNAKSYVICPIGTNDEIHGVVIADKGRDTVHEISPMEVQTLEEISTTLAVAISKQMRFDDLNETLTVLKRYNPKVFEDNKIDKDKVSLAGSRKTVVSGFLDVRGFTNISDIYPPEVIIELINNLALLCEEALDPECGHIDKFIGDEFFFTWENKDPEILIESAFKTVLKIKNALELFNEEAKRKNYPLVKVGIGLDVGQVIRGNIGTELRMDYTSIGSSVNKAARLQSLNKEYESTLIISQGFYDLLESQHMGHFKKETVSIRGFDKDEDVFILEE